MIKSLICQRNLAVAVVLSLSVVYLGCGVTSQQVTNPPVNTPTKAQVSVFLKDAPADDVVAFNLTITDAALFDSGGKRLPLLTFSRSFELRQLRLASALAISSAAIDPATVSTLEVGLSTPRLTVYGANGARQQLTETTTPSVSLANSRVSLPINFTVAAGQSQGLMLDFDVKNSLSVDSSGNYLITPVLKPALTGTGGENELSMSLVKIAGVQSTPANSMDVQLPTIGETLHIKVDANTAFDPAIGQFSSLKSGQMIELEAKFQPDGTYLAKYVNQGAPDPTLRFQGVLMDTNQSGSNPAMEMVTR